MIRTALSNMAASSLSTVNFMKFKFRSSIFNKNFNIQIEMCSNYKIHNGFQRLNMKKRM